MLTFFLRPKTLTSYRYAHWLKFDKTPCPKYLKNLRSNK
jgi:hypothetical protein